MSTREYFREISGKAGEQYEALGFFFKYMM